MSCTGPRVEVTTTIGAPRERLFDAWLNPGPPRSLPVRRHVARIEVDARVGGAFRVV